MEDKEKKIKETAKDLIKDLTRENVEQKAKIKQLTEELDNEYELRKKYMFDCEKKDLELNQLEFEKNELKKQVDELQDRLASVLVGIKADELLVAKGINQAIKDTAKDIFAELFYMAIIYHSDVANILAWAKEKANSMGVEIK